MRKATKAIDASRCPPLTTRTRRGLFSLARLLRGDFSLARAMLLEAARNAEERHEIEDALEWVGALEKHHESRGTLRRRVVSEEVGGVDNPSAA